MKIPSPFSSCYKPVARQANRQQEANGLVCLNFFLLTDLETRDRKGRRKKEERHPATELKKQIRKEERK
jgi:hypothetical protein